MDKWGIAWDGQMDVNPNGDYYLVADVAELEDEVERLRAQLAASVPAEGIKTAPAPTGSRGVFGYCSAKEAGQYLAGKLRTISLSRRRHTNKPFPVYFNDQPSMFVVGDRELPPLRSMVAVPEGIGRVHSYSNEVRGGVVVRLMQGGGRIVSSDWKRIGEIKAAISNA